MLSRQSWRRRRDLRRSWHGSRYSLIRFRNYLQITKQVTVSLAGVTVREQEALQCLLDLPIDRFHENLSPLRVIINQECQLIQDVICHCHQHLLLLCGSDLRPRLCRTLQRRRWHCLPCLPHTQKKDGENLSVTLNNI